MDRTILFTISCLLSVNISAQIVRIFYQDTLCRRRIIKDNQQHILGWYKPEIPGAAYDKVVRLASEFMKNTPIEPKNGSYYVPGNMFDLAILRSIYSEDGTRDQAEINRLYLHGIWDNVLTVPEADKENRAKFPGHTRDITLKNVSVVDGPFPFSVFYGSDKT